jgi:hypothetical protein
MTTREHTLSVLICLLALPFFSATSFAQERRQLTSAPSPSPDSASNQAGMEAVANQVGMLRQSVQSLDATLSDIADKLLPVFSKAKDTAAESQSRISTSFTLLTQAEQRAEMLRKQLLELIEKETSYQIRLTQIDEDMRPENIERALNPYGTTRTAEMRDTRRRVLESERRGYQNLLTLATGNRTRLEEEVRQADALVMKLRLRLNPLIDREIDKIKPEP